MIAQDARTFLADLERLQRLRQDANREADLEERARRITSEAEKFTKPQAFINLAVAEGIAVAAPNGEAGEQTAATLAALSVKHNADPDRVLGNALDDALRQTASLAQATTARARTAWIDFCRQTYWAEQRQLMSRLEMNSDGQTRFGRIVRKLFPLATTVSEINELQYPTQAQFRTRQNAEEEFERLSEALWGESGLDPEIEGFLREAHGDRGAALQLLKPVVLDWLTSFELLDRYTIRPK